MLKFIVLFGAVIGLIFLSVWLFTYIFCDQDEDIRLNKTSFVHDIFVRMFQGLAGYYKGQNSKTGGKISDPVKGVVFETVGNLISGLDPKAAVRRELDEDLAKMLNRIEELLPEVDTCGDDSLKELLVACYNELGATKGDIEILHSIKEIRRRIKLVEETLENIRVAIEDLKASGATSSRNAFKDYYGVLGVAEDATQDEIKKAYRNLSKQYHPDANLDKDEAARKQCEEKFKDINEAYAILGNVANRASYDRSRKGKS